MVADRQGKADAGAVVAAAHARLWLIVLENTVIGFGWSLWFPYLIFLQVIWAIGWSMLFLAALVWLPRAAVLGGWLADCLRATTSWMVFRRHSWARSASCGMC